MWLWKTWYVIVLQVIIVTCNLSESKLLLIAHLWDSTPTILQPFFQDYLDEPVSEETFTHSHLSWSSTIFYQLLSSILLRSIASSLFNLCAWQSFCTTSLQVLFGSTSWPGTLQFILHGFLHPIIVFFLQHMPIPSQPVLL